MVSLNLNGLALGMMSRRNTTTPRPPMKWVDERQNIRLRGRPSTFVRMVEPVVVYPETLSKRAFTRENSPPHITYGSIPNRNDSIHDSTIIMNPS